MYVPAHFKEENAARIAGVMRANSFATLITFDGARPFASHVPLVLRPEREPHGALMGHIARANPQWRHFAGGAEVLAIFTGPHAYISPGWYSSPHMVPTWNYVAVHAYGVPRVVQESAALEEILRLTVNEYESGQPAPWQDALPPDHKAGMMKAIVGFEIEITRLEAKFKLSQNRTPEDIAGAVAALGQSPSQTERELAALMKSQYEQRAAGTK